MAEHSHAQSLLMLGVAQQPELGSGALPVSGQTHWTSGSEVPLNPVRQSLTVGNDATLTASPHAIAAAKVLVPTPFPLPPQQAIGVPQTMPDMASLPISQPQIDTMPDVLVPGLTAPAMMMPSVAGMMPSVTGMMPSVTGMMPSMTGMMPSVTQPHISPPMPVAQHYDMPHASQGNDYLAGLMPATHPHTMLFPTVGGSLPASAAASTAENVQQMAGLVPGPGASSSSPACQFSMDAVAAAAAAAAAATTATANANAAAAVSAPTVADQGAAAGGPVRRRASKGKQGWTREEDIKIVQYVQLAGQKWAVIAALLPGRTDDAVRNRYLRLQKKKGGSAGGSTGGDGDDPGAEVSAAGGARVGAAGASGCLVTSADLADCETVKKGDMWTEEEDRLITEAVARYGQKWQQISEQVPGRSANAVRNRFLRCCSNGLNTQASVATGGLAVHPAPQQPPQFSPTPGVTPGVLQQATPAVAMQPPIATAELAYAHSRVAEQSVQLAQS